MTLKPNVVLLELHMPDGGECEPAFVESQLQLSGARVLGMSLSSGEDEVSRVLLKASVQWHCRIRLKFGHELIPAFCGWVRRARRRTLVQLPKDGPDVDLLGAGAYNSCTTVPGTRYRSRWVQPPFSIFKTRDDGSFHWSRVRKTSNPPGARRKTCEVVAW